MDTTYCLHLNGHRPVVSAVDREAVDRLRERPGNWALTHDEELAQFLCGEIFSQSDVAGNLGCIRDYVESIAVSSYSVSLLLSFHATNHIYVKGNGMFSYSMVSSSWGFSRHFTLHPIAYLFIHMPSQLLQEAFSHAAITVRRLFVQISTCL